MLPQTNRLPQPSRWQRELAEAITHPAELLRLLDLPAETISRLTRSQRGFPLRVPRAFIGRMRKGDPADPLLRQVLPLAEEEVEVPGFLRDPVGDLAAAAVPGVLHKYHGRVLLVTTGACGVHCRYCFRRHFPYADANPAVQRWQDAINYIHSHADVSEVILSGGDPLAISDSRLADLVERVAAIPHVKRLRIHTRLPIVLPLRVDEHLLDWLERTRVQKVVVVHANHPNEIDEEVMAAMQKLRDAGAILLNQSVLLKGVNDNAEDLADLSERLFEASILPYYLHLLDKVQGAAHFEVDHATAMRLMEALRARLPGYLVPRLVRELPGADSKTPAELLQD
jgi:EF-P beta-lysylation protein EpmB